jgi:hypothetical protein
MDIKQHYGIDEIECMRKVLYKLVYQYTGCTGYELARLTELRLHTYMLNGINPEELEALESKGK